MQTTRIIYFDDISWHLPNDPHSHTLYILYTYAYTYGIVTITVERINKNLAKTTTYYIYNKCITSKNATIVIFIIMTWHGESYIWLPSHPIKTFLILFIIFVHKTYMLTIDLTGINEYLYKYILKYNCT